MRVLLIIAVVLCCTSCSVPEAFKPGWKFPMQVIESREAWEQATGRDLQYEDGLGSNF